MNANNLPEVSFIDDSDIANNFNFRLLRSILDPHGKETFICLMNDTDEAIAVEDGLELGQCYALTEDKMLTSTVSERSAASTEEIMQES